MGAHPDFEGKPLPREAAFGPFRLEVLSPKDVDEDYRIVCESAAVVDGIFGNDWPRGLTLEKNLEDLTRHAREFDDCEAFAWIIRDADGTYLGCAYVRPVVGERAAKVFTWIRERADRLALLSEFNTAFRTWLTPQMPEGYALRWVSNDR